MFNYIDPTSYHLDTDQQPAPIPAQLAHARQRLLDGEIDLEDYRDLADLQGPTIVEWF